ncbi:MAG: hypothetical protein WD379_08415 [Dehalococcoidia bacterium]
MSFFFTNPFGMILGILMGIISLGVLFILIISVLAVVGGPGQCTAGGPAISITQANSDAFQQKWDAMDDTLDGGSPASIDLDESEVSSRADRYLTDETDAPFGDVRVCLHDGSGEGSGTISILGIDVEVKVKGNMEMTGGSPVATIDDIEVGSVPGFATDVIEGIVEDAIEEGLNDIELNHDYQATLTEGNAKIDGTP